MVSLPLSLYIYIYIEIYIYIYIYMAKASFSAYVLVKVLLETEEKCTFRPKKARPISVFLFASSLFPFLPLKIAKICCFCLAKSQKVGRKRGLRLIYIYIYIIFLLSLSLCFFFSLYFSISLSISPYGLPPQENFWHFNISPVLGMSFQKDASKQDMSIC